MSTVTVIGNVRRAVQKFWLQQQLNQIDLNYYYQLELAKERTQAKVSPAGPLLELEKLEAERERVLGCLREFA